MWYLSVVDCLFQSWITGIRDNVVNSHPNLINEGVNTYHEPEFYSYVAQIQH